jgi:hypothetical protein
MEVPMKRKGACVNTRRIGNKKAEMVYPPVSKSWFHG